MLAGRISEIKILKPGIIRLFVSEYYDVLSADGKKYNFETLDKMVDDIRKTGAKPFMSFCLKPKFFYPVIDQDIVEPNDYKKWERFVYNVVKHYKDRNSGIVHWEVGNEVDIGEDGGTPYRFKPEAYATYYKHTVAAIRKADPEAKVGGPALSWYKSPILPELLRRSSAEKLPLDFVSFHTYHNSPTAIREQIRYVKALIAEYPSLRPETIINEWNMDLFNPPLDPRFQPCYVAESIWQMKDAGLDWSAYYQIRDWYVSYDTFEKVFSKKGAAFMTRWWNRQAQFSGLIDYQNQLRPAYFTFKLLSRMAGNKMEMNSSDDKVHGFATHDPQLDMHNMMLWNFSDQPKTISINLENFPKDMRIRHITLDATGSGMEENQRLRPAPFVNLKKGSHTLTIKLEPWAVHYWSLE
ncbi:GH39 family glycosyl hydrolase [Pedobacter sp.]|uniref:GH39 family glycosyl hydrolase n=1 Tax=Pedobacter sp. TaxID=1411316 RepID=UPI003D7F68B6